jgi:hypothetical protein
VIGVTFYKLHDGQSQMTNLYSGAVRKQVGDLQGPRPGQMIKYLLWSEMLNRYANRIHTPFVVLETSVRVRGLHCLHIEIRFCEMH